MGVSITFSYAHYGWLRLVLIAIHRLRLLNCACHPYSVFQINNIRVSQLLSSATGIGDGFGVRFLLIPGSEFSIGISPSVVVFLFVLFFVGNVLVVGVRNKIFGADIMSLSRILVTAFSILELRLLRAFDFPVVLSLVTSAAVWSVDRHSTFSDCLRDWGRPLPSFNCSLCAADLRILWFGVIFRWH